MTEKQLEEATTKKFQISKLERCINSCNTSVYNTIMFTHGNGSNRSVVCIENDIFLLVKELILRETEAKIQILKEEFNSI